MQSLPHNEEQAAKVLQEHVNLQQLLVHVVNASLTVGEWGRGTGKSTIAIAGRTVHNAKTMPRSAGSFAAPSFRKFIDHMWPGIRKGYTEKFKLKEGRDFVFLKTPPDHWQRPYMSPGQFLHFITFRNGSGYHIISQDHGQSANALDTDWNVTDEAKLQNGERIQEEVFNTLRGNKDVFGHLSEHHSRWIFSDKYIRTGSKQSRWFGDYKAKASSPAQIQNILLHWLALQETTNEQQRAIIMREMVKLQRNALFYSEASTIDNIHVVGMEFIENMAKSNTAYGLLTSIFNMDVSRREGSLFYKYFSESVHSYNASDNSRVSEYIERYGYDEYKAQASCRLDTDLKPGVPLDVLMDFGGTFNWAVVGQSSNTERKALKEFIAQSPLKLRDLVKQICSYYKPHNRKYIRLFYDIGGDKSNPVSVKTYIDNVIEWFEEEQWNVEDMCADVPNYPSHKMKFEFWEKVLDETEQRDHEFPKFRANASNCFYLIQSMAQAQLQNGERLDTDTSYKKDKKKEKDPKFDQRQATHLSDCVDWWIIEFMDKLGEHKSEFPSFHTK